MRIVLTVMTESGQDQRPGAQAPRVVSALSWMLVGLIVTWATGAMASDRGCRAQERGLIGRLSRQVLSAGGQCMQLTTLAVFVCMAHVGA